MAARLREDVACENPVVIAVILFAILAAEVSATPESTLCVEGVCRPVAQAPFLSASDVPRSFVWVSHDSIHIVAGTIQAGASAVSITDDSLVAHRLTAATSDGAAEVEVDFELRCESTWRWVAKAGPRSALEIRHPPGKCILVLDAEGYRSIEQPLTTADLGRVERLQRTESTAAAN